MSGGDAECGVGYGEDRVLAVILSRAGSKGVPGKNTALVGGRPCIEWTIDTALRSKTACDVVVSTDCQRSAAISRARGIVVIDRPVKLASDTATVDAAARHAVLQYERARGALAPRGPIVILYANVPVRPAGLVDDAVRLLRESGAESVQSYASVGKYHPWWTCVVSEGDQTVRPFDGEPSDPLYHGTYRRQSLPPAHIPDGGVIVVTRRALMLEVQGSPNGPHAFLGPASSRRGIVTKEGAVIDIDSPVDLIVANALVDQGRVGGVAMMSSCEQES